MEVFLFGLPPTTTEKRLTKYLSEKLKLFGIEIFKCEKTRRSGCATVTLLDKVNGERFLQFYTNNGGKLVLEKPFKCARSKHQADEFKLRCLEKRITDKANKVRKGAPGPPTLKQFSGSSVSCGVWDYPAGNLTYVPYFMIMRPLRIYFGRRELVVVLHQLDESSAAPELRMGIPYSSIQGLTCARMRDAPITLTLYHAPKLYEFPEGPSKTRFSNDPGDALAAELEPLARLLRLSLNAPDDNKPQPPKRLRTTGLNRDHAKIVGFCNVYQLTLSAGHVRAIKDLLNQKTFLPDITYWPFRVAHGPVTQKLTLQELLSLLQESYHHLEFGIKFQLQKLAQNSYLLPDTVLQLLPVITRFKERWGLEATVYGLRQMSKEINWAGPQSQAYLFSIEHLEHLLNKQDHSTDSMSPFVLARRYPHLVLIHRAEVTPTGIYLDGPYAEKKNNVLDRYSEFAASYFLRVTFQDENGEPLKYERHADLSEIHGSRFRDVLNNGIDIVGQKFRFLGFSHSSLRDQSCWFCAPFIKGGSLIWGSRLIKQLGDFSAIRSPAKCAARIGQAFTDLDDNVPLSRLAVRNISDIERNGRCFSDGCSTASKAVFQKLWKGYKPGKFKPSLFQIRYGGVKGMISLDKSLKGEVLHVRPSQEKFPSGQEMLGICGAAKRQLPFLLNRSLIKVLEDLGVPKSNFMALQREAIDELRAIAHSPENAAAFLEIHDIGKSSNFSWLVRELYHMGIVVLSDHFVWSAVELVLIMRLRDLKYRGRIPVANGATLFGIMDETGVLKKDEVYCALAKTKIIKGRVAVTRSPALHPGDVQYVNAVDVPTDSALKDLHNCIVFSQHGSRDIPSQLSGGDLDGDHFNIIADPRLLPPRTVEPADYPRQPPIDIKRDVETKDITNFFIDFMSNDQLGRISNAHLQLADQKLRGTESAECIKLTEMHSIAVDFSKTGIPVSTEGMPRTGHCKPDFMATGPRVIIQDRAAALEQDDSHGLYQDEEEDVLEDLDPETRKVTYYTSEKTLGHLYRAVDEQKFLDEAQSGKRDGTAESQSVLKTILQYVKDKTRGIIWDHLRPWALDIKEQYEYAISDMMFANSLDPRKPLSEVEVFVGHVMGKDGGGASKRAREMARTVREQFDELVQYSIECILKDENEEFTEEALERSIACLAVAVENVTEAGPRVGKLESFGYLAAAICLRQVKRFSRDGF